MPGSSEQRDTRDVSGVSPVSPARSRRLEESDVGHMLLAPIGVSPHRSWMEDTRLPIGHLATAIRRHSCGWGPWPGGEDGAGSGEVDMSLVHSAGGYLRFDPCLGRER